MQKTYTPSGVHCCPTSAAGELEECFCKGICSVNHHHTPCDLQNQLRKHTYDFTRADTVLSKLGVKASRQQNKPGKQKGGEEVGNQKGNQKGGEAATREPTLTEARGPSQPLQTEPSSSAAAHGTVPPFANGTGPSSGITAGDAGVRISTAQQASDTAANSKGAAAPAVGSPSSTQTAVEAAANCLAGRKRGREQCDSLQGESAAKHAKPDALGGDKPMAAAPLQSNSLNPGSAAEPVKLYNVRK